MSYSRIIIIQKIEHGKELQKEILRAYLRAGKVLDCVLFEPAMVGRSVRVAAGQSSPTNSMRQYLRPTSGRTLLL